MIVTRSSVISLQAKEGLPLGNQIVGWAVLGLFVDFNYGLESHELTLLQLSHSPCLSYMGCSQIITIYTASSYSSSRSRPSSSSSLYLTRACSTLLSVPLF